jgi:glycosyltransferase involved in cell wall biosynthesis
MKLSVITVCLNDKTGLEKTVLSVLGQTYSNFEYIIIDGGSVDGSVDILQKFTQKLSYWVSEKDSGIYQAMNKGIQKAKGEYCLFLNAGDYFVSGNVLADVFNRMDNSDIIYGDMVLKEKHGKFIEKKSHDKLTIRKMLTDTLWHPVSFIRRDLFNKFGLYDETFKIAGDYDFFVKVIVAHKVKTKHLSIPICIFDATGLSSDPKNKSLLLKERRRVQNKYFNPLLLLVFRLYSKIRS